jgi:Sulfatase
MRVSRLLRPTVAVAGLWAIAVAHPLLDVLGRAPEFFVAHRAGAIEILLLVATLILVAPLALAGCIAVAAAFGPRVRTTVTAVFVGALVALGSVQLLKAAGVATWLAAAALAIVAGAVAAGLQVRIAFVRTFFSMLGVSVLIMPLVFLQQPGIRRLVLPAGHARATADPAAPGLRRSPIVLLVFDELPLVSLLNGDRSIDPAAYPNLAALARDGVWFRNATTVSDYTRWALPSILTGRRARPEDIPTPGDHPDTLFTYFGRSHQLEVYEPVTNLCPRGLCPDTGGALGGRLAAMARDLAIVAAYVFLTPDLHDRLQLPDLTTNWAGFSVADDFDARASQREWQRHVNQEFRTDRREIVAQFVGGISPSDPQPTFYFLHVLLPHQPWMLLPTGQRNGSPAPLPSAMRVVARNDDWEIAQNQQRHLLQVGYVDHAVGTVLARLRQTGLYERALVVVTADHGVSITKGHHVRAFSQGNAPEIMRVPLIMKFPSGVSASGLDVHVTAEGQRVCDRNVETVDIAPTIAHALGVPLPWRTDGASLLDAAVRQRAEKRIAFGQGRREQRYGPEGPPLEGVLRRRHETFGDANVYHVPRPPRFRELVGRAVADLRVLDTPATVDIGFSWMYAAFDPDADAVPFEVSGQLHDARTETGPVYLAVAVNGVVRAVTRTWTLRAGGWMATPPLDAWRRGANSIDVFTIEEIAGEPVLGRLGRHMTRPDDLNLVTGAAEQYWNVRQRGFYRHEGKAGLVFRWTRARASVTVPLLGRRPTAIGLRIARPFVPTTKLRVTANGCAVYDGVVPRNEWEVTLPLATCEVKGDELTIALETDAERPRSGRERRILGVAVRHITLQTDEPDTPR